MNAIKERPAQYNHNRFGPALVTGAGGSMGELYVRRLAQNAPEDKPVRAMARSDKDLNRLAQIPGVQPVKADLNNPEQVQRALAGVGTVFHLAASLSQTDMDLAKKVNVEGTENLARAANTEGVRHVHLVSTVGTYGAQDTSRPLTEDLPLNAQDPYGYTKAQQEKILFEGGNSFETSAVRPSNVIGPEIDVWTHLMLNVINGITIDISKLPDGIKEKVNKIGLRRFTPPMSLAAIYGSRAVFAYVDIENLIDLSMKASQNPDAVGEAFNGVDRNTTWGRMLNTYARNVFGKNIYKFPDGITDFIVDKSADLLKQQADKSGNDFLRRIADYVTNGGSQYSTEKADTMLGHTHRVSLRDSVMATREYVKEHGLILSKQIYNI